MMILRVTCRYCLGGSTVSGGRSVLQVLERVLDAEEALGLRDVRGLTPEEVVGALQQLRLLEREQHGDRAPVLLDGHGLYGRPCQVLTQAVLDLGRRPGLHTDSEDS